MKLDTTAELSLRRATEQDESYLLLVRNADDVRAQSKNHEAINEEAHSVWFRMQLRNPAVAIWIVEVDGQSAGYLRVQQTGAGDWLLSLALERQYRGRGLGLKAIQQASRLSRSQLGARRLVAEVLATNAIGQRMFVAAGFSIASHFQETGRQFARFERNLDRP